MAARKDAAAVTIFTTNDPGLLAVAQSLLEAARIDFFVAGESVTAQTPGGAVGPFGAAEIRVADEDAEDARALLEGLR